MELGRAENDEQRESTYRILNDEIDARHAALIEEARATETKATVVAGFAVASVSFLLDQHHGRAWWSALAATVGALVCAVAVLWPRPWASVDPEHLLGALGHHPPVDVVCAVAWSKVDLVATNSRRSLRMVVLWRTSVAFLALGMALSVGNTITEVQR